MLSYILPGFDQFYEGQYSYALGYAGTAAFGTGFALNNSKDLQIDEGVNPLSARSLRPYLWGTQLWSLSGSLSAYQSFRSAAISRRNQGQFDFLRQHDEISDVLMAPLDFDFLQRPTTYIPLLVAASINFLTWEAAGSEPDYHRRSLNGGDLFYANAYHGHSGYL
jgi:hypothetical protein